MGKELKSKKASVKNHINDYNTRDLKKNMMSATDMLNCLAHIQV